jgi:hypothetical protein
MAALRRHNRDSLYSPPARASFTFSRATAAWNSGSPTGPDSTEPVRQVSAHRSPHRRIPDGSSEHAINESIEHAHSGRDAD